MPVRAIRGATCLRSNDPDEMAEAVQELLTNMFESNAVDHDDVISILFTATPDLNCGFPATAARALGLADVPLMCAQELDVPGALQQVVRVMAHVELARPRSEVVHSFLRGAHVLREDLQRERS